MEGGELGSGSRRVAGRPYSDSCHLILIGFLQVCLSQSRRNETVKKLGFYKRKKKKELQVKWQNSHKKL